MSKRNFDISIPASIDHPSIISFLPSNRDMVPTTGRSPVNMIE